jgi:hypothetical protein
LPSPTTVEQADGQAVFLCIGSLRATIRICRDEYVLRLLVNIRAITSM